MYEKFKNITEKKEADHDDLLRIVIGNFAFSRQ